MSKKITEEDVKRLLKQNNNKEFKSFFSTRVLAKIENYENIPLFGIWVANRIFLKQYFIAACVIFLVMFSISILQDGSISIDNLLGLGKFSEEDIINYTNPLI
ncbi:MAG: hypothetical protein HUU47_07720 [Bacteroidetes bacterium]|nr:hypothetical protein [Bacteroidota bacterium]